MKYSVQFYYHTTVTVEVEAEDEQDAIETAYSEVCDPKYDEQLKMNLTEDGDPDVEEI